MPTKDPISVLLEYVVEKNFKLPALVYAILSVLLVLVLIRTAIRYFVRSGKPAPLNAYFSWALLPLVFVYITFFALGAERYMGRYFAFCFPPLPVLLVLAIEQAVESLNVARPWLRFSLSRHYLRYALLYALAICAVFALPRTYAGAISVKEPYSRHRALDRQARRRHDRRKLRSVRGFPYYPPHVGLLHEADEHTRASHRYDWRR